MRWNSLENNEESVKKSIELSGDSTRILFGAGDKYIRQLEEELMVRDLVWKLK